MEIFTKLKIINETRYFFFKFENKKDFYVTSKNSLAFDLIQKWPNWNNQFFFLYGPTKCGKTTICKIWQKKSKAIFLNKKNRKVS